MLERTLTDIVPAFFFIGANLPITEKTGCLTTAGTNIQIWLKPIFYSRYDLYVIIFMIYLVMSVLSVLHPVRKMMKMTKIDVLREE